MTQFKDLKSHIPFGKSVLFTTTLVLALVIGGCSSGPNQFDRSVEIPAETVDEEVTIPELLQIAIESASPQREELLLQASNQALKESTAEVAVQILNYIEYGQVDYGVKARYLVQRITIALHERKPEEALAIFQDSRYELNNFFDHLAQTDQANLSRLRAQSFELSGNLMEAIMERIFLTRILFDSENAFAAAPSEDVQERIQSNNDAIWFNFLSLPPQTLAQLADRIRQQHSPNHILLGWLKLIQVNSKYSENIYRRIDEIELWRANWASHPAAQFFPTDLSGLVAASKFQPERLAVILPQTGKLSRASNILMNGLLSAYYHSRSNDIKTPEIMIYDSEEGDIIETYETAIASGAQMVIGPLNKKHVDALFLYGKLSVPTLALNYTTLQQEPPKNFYQFGLAAEDEVEQIADRAFLENHRFAVVLYPDTEWGKRVKYAFDEHWRSLDGVVAAEAAFKPGENFSSLIKKTLQLGDSEERARKIKRLFNERVEFKPRRRQDVDFVIVLGNPREARQIVPTLAFHYAHDIPVYSTSNVYSGHPKPVADKDLNGVIFTELPWVLNEKDPIKAYFREQVGTSPQSLTRLQAMGADAYRLHQQLPVITLGHRAIFNGSTGQISMGDKNRIKRKASWALFKSGKAVVDSNAPVFNLGGEEVVPAKENSGPRYKSLLPHREVR